MKLTYIGGPTLLLELNGLRLLTDPTFDAAGESYTTHVTTLKKSADPAIKAEALGQIDVVLLSHDHHFDNLDHAGRALLSRAGTVLTTQAGAERLGGNAVGLAHWQSIDVPAPQGGSLRITATPARHGPVNGDRGPVIGFAVSASETPERALYFSGDTVWYEGVHEVSRKFKVQTAILNMGAARIKEVGPDNLTFTAEESVEAARAFADAAIIPLHYEGWAHFSESRKDIERAFSASGMGDRLRWLEPGRAADIPGPTIG